MLVTKINKNRGGRTAERTTYNPAAGIIEAKLESQIGFAEMKEVIAECTTIAQEAQCYDWLIDLSDTEEKFSTMEIFAIPALIHEAAEVLGVIGGKIKWTMVAAQKTEDHRFAENTAYNRGLRMRVFEDIGQARAWLKG